MAGDRRDLPALPVGLSRVLDNRHQQSGGGGGGRGRSPPAPPLAPAGGRPRRVRYRLRQVGGRGAARFPLDFTGFPYPAVLSRLALGRRALAYCVELALAWATNHSCTSDGLCGTSALWQKAGISSPSLPAPRETLQNRACPPADWQYRYCQARLVHLVTSPQSHRTAEVQKSFPLFP